MLCELSDCHNVMFKSENCFQIVRELGPFQSINQSISIFKVAKVTMTTDSPLKKVS